MCSILSTNRVRTKLKRGNGREEERERERGSVSVLGGSRDRIQVTVAIALKRTCTKVRCMYDPAILPPLAPLIYIGSDLPILCITRARIVISLWASEVQSSGMAMAGARSRARIYRFAPCTSLSALFRGWKPRDPRSIFPQSRAGRSSRTRSLPLRNGGWLFPGDRSSRDFHFELVPAERRVWEAGWRFQVPGSMSIIVHVESIYIIVPD